MRRRGQSPLRAVLATLLVLPLTVALIAPQRAEAGATPPVPEQFNQSAMAVLPGTSVSLFWSAPDPPDASEYYIITSASPHALPGFGSSSVVSFPTGWSASWNSTWKWWVDSVSNPRLPPTAYAITVAIPSGATAGTEYAFELYTCNSQTNLCSNSPGGSGDSEVTLTVAGSSWSSVPYSADYTTVVNAEQSGGDPLDVAFDPAGDILDSSEFSDSIDELPAGGGQLTAPYVDPYDASASPFAYDFGTWTASEDSALGERIVDDGKFTWSTQGGWEFYDCASSNSLSPCPANHSEIVAFDPSTGNFCTYQAPGDDNEVMGVASTGIEPDNEIWFVESNLSHSYLAWFYPAQVGAGCSGLSDESYTLGPGVGDFHQLTWPGLLPAQIAVDPSGTHLWVTNFWGGSVSEVNTSTRRISTYSLHSRNSRSFFGAEPWQVAADADYVYVIDYGDDNLVRIDKADPSQIDQVPIPLTSSDEEGYGLALEDGKLYFTLADDPRPTFGAMSTFGYVNVASWEAASAKCSPGVDCAAAPTDAVAYTGLANYVDPSHNSDGSPDSDFRGIAVDSAGTVAIADTGDVGQIIRLTPSGGASQPASHRDPAAPEPLKA